MKTKVIITLALAASMGLASCSDKGLTPERTKIYGQLGDYFAVVEKEYSLNDGNINVEIERIDEDFPDPYEDGMKIGYSYGEAEPTFTVEFLDAKGNVIDKKSTDIVCDRDDLIQLAATRVGETSSIKFKVPKGSVKFKMTSSFVCHEPKNATEDIVNSLSKVSDVFDDAAETSIKDVEDVAKAVKGVLDIEKNILDELF